MKRTPVIMTAIALSVVSISVYAEQASSADTEFLQLREKRDKALAAVAEPINDGYRASLEQLLKRALADKDTAAAAKIQFELQSLGAVGTSPSLPALTNASLPALTPEMTALQQLLADTKWRINNDKTFLLQAGGTSTSNWTPRKGHWKVLDATTVELDIGNIKRQEKVIVSQGGTLMTWTNREEDQQYSQVAKKIVPIADK